MDAGLNELRDKVAEACRVLGQLDITHEALGHVSARIGDTNTVLIKGKGPAEVGLRYTTERDVIVVDFDANKLEGPDDLQPPSESFLHLWLYKMRPEVRSVVHMHPRQAVLLTICKKPIVPIYGAFGGGAQLALHGVPVYPRSVTIHNDKLGEEFARFMGSNPACLMKGHGAAVVGNSVEQATVTTLMLNELTSMLYEAYAIGEPDPISQEDIEMMSRPAAETAGRGSVRGELGMLAKWRYYKSLAEDRARAGS